jgi:rod shape determining protein RodA
VAVGVVAMLFWQVFDNIGMVIGLLPVTGITLPLMSYGGSSMLSVMLSIGLLVNISMRRHMF